VFFRVRRHQHRNVHWLRDLELHQRNGLQYDIRDRIWIDDLRFRFE
jgi:hypothetical protein